MEDYEFFSIAIITFFCLLILSLCFYTFVSMTNSKTIFVFNNITCLNGRYDSCGYNLDFCDNGKEYLCATNVEVRRVST